jgi:hypothetical protein
MTLRRWLSPLFKVGAEPVQIAPTWIVGAVFRSRELGEMFREQIAGSCKGAACYLTRPLDAGKALASAIGS